MKESDGCKTVGIFFFQMFTGVQTIEIGIEYMQTY